jgi:hypothetical protein
MSKRFTWMVTALLAACAASGPSQQDNVAVTPRNDTAGASVIRRPLPPSPSVPDARAAPPASAPAVVVPEGLLYVCVTDTAGTHKQVGIEFTPKVHDLCSRHPEMGPCQYERQACRAAGGRVFARSGEEITLATEAEYDKKVRRVRFRSN